MKKQILELAQIFILAVGASLFAPSMSLAFSPSTSDEMAIAEVISVGYAAAINSEDQDAFAQLFAEGATRVPPNRAPETTRENIKTGIENVFKTFDFEVVLKLHHVTVDGDFALAQGIATGKRSKTADGKTINFQARSVWLLNRVDNNWRIWSQAWYPIKKVK